MPNADLRTMCINVGDTMEVKVLKVNDGEGQVQLSDIQDVLLQRKATRRLEEAFENTGSTESTCNTGTGWRTYA